MARERIDYETASFANAGIEELEKYERWLLAQQDKQEHEARKTAVFKTVDTFASIMQRKMWIKNSQVAYTDGHEIGVPLENKNVYEYAEHEIAHNLFLSNFRAKELFCNEYVKQISAALQQSGVTLDAGNRGPLHEMIGMLLNVLEDHRINSLWALLYPGSYKRLAEVGAEMLQKHRKEAHSDLVTYFLLVAYDVADIPTGRFDRFGPAMVAALKKVERKNPSSTFVVGKWLMTQLVSEIIRQLKQLPPPPTAGKARVVTDIDVQSVSAQGSEGQSGEGESDDNDGDDNAEAGDGDDSGSPDGSGAGGNSDGSTDSQKGSGTEWTPPPVEFTKQDRVDALKELIQVAKSPSPKALNAARERLKDVHEERHPSKNAHSTALELVKLAMDTNVADDSALALHLSRSEDSMKDTIDSLKEALERVRQTTEDEWIVRDVHAKVRFVDVERAPTNAVDMDEHDRVAVRRMRDLFQRVRSKTSKQLSEAGHEIDIESFINNKVGRLSGPVFKTEVSGRGFKTLILVDRSSSMCGPRTDSAERATRILRQSLKHPNVEFHVWGFQSTDSAVTLTRIGKNVDLQNTGKMAVSGTTPLHIACKAAVNWMGSGHEKKQLIILTDGLPCFTSSSGKQYGEEQLVQLVRKEVVRARKQGINVTTLVIGSEVSDEHARTMFGERRNWIRANEGDLDKKLVRVTSSSFVDYLSHG